MRTDIHWEGLGTVDEMTLFTQKFGRIVLGAFVKKNLAGFIYVFLARRKKS